MRLIGELRVINAESLPPARRTRDSFRDQSIKTLVEFSIEQIDRDLPPWARRSHPVIRRHLGAYWKTFTPDLGALVRVFLMLAGITILTIVIPTLYTLLVPTVTVSLVMLPIGGWMYITLLYNVGAFAVDTINSERRSDTLTVLRSTPLSLRELLFSKTASAVWRYVEDLNLVTLAVLLTSLPLLLILYHAALREAASPLIVGFIVILALASFTVRIFFETVMIAALGILMGTANFTRSAAILSTTLTALGYFILINLARLLPLSGFGLIAIEIILPLLLPVLITAASLAITAYLIERD